MRVTEEVQGKHTTNNNPTHWSVRVCMHTGKPREQFLSLSVCVCERVSHFLGMLLAQQLGFDPHLLQQLLHRFPEGLSVAFNLSNNGSQTMPSTSVTMASINQTRR